MSEDYKKIALEDVKKGQRVRIVERHSAFTATYEGAVLKTSSDLGRIDLGEKGDEVTIIVDPEPEPGIDFDIFLLEDAPKPKVIRTTTVKYYDDGTKEETVMVPMEIKTMEQFYEHQDYLKTVILKDADKDYWAYRDGQWKWAFSQMLPGITWYTPSDLGMLSQSLPLTVVENVGD